MLATGAMLVDLPGVRDANAARGRVAESYLKASWSGCDCCYQHDLRTQLCLAGAAWPAHVATPAMRDAINPRFHGRNLRSHRWGRVG